MKGPYFFFLRRVVEEDLQYAEQLQSVSIFVLVMVLIISPILIFLVHNSTQTIQVSCCCSHYWSLRSLKRRSVWPISKSSCYLYPSPRPLLLDWWLKRRSWSENASGVIDCSVKCCPKPWWNNWNKRNRLDLLQSILYMQTVLIIPCNRM